MNRKGQVEEEELVIRPMAEWDQVGIAADECMVREPGCYGQMQRVHRAVVQGGAVGRRAGPSAEQCQDAGEVILDARIVCLDPAYR